MHNVRIPLWTKFAAPERYGLGPFKTRNLAITTADGETLGAWHTLSVPACCRSAPRSPADDRPRFPFQAKYHLPQPARRHLPANGAV